MRAVFFNGGATYFRKVLKVEWNYSGTKGMLYQIRKCLTLLLIESPKGQCRNYWDGEGGLTLCFSLWKRKPFHGVIHALFELLLAEHCNTLPTTTVLTWYNLCILYPNLSLNIMRELLMCNTDEHINNTWSGDRTVVFCIWQIAPLWTLHSSPKTAKSKI